MLRPPPGAAGRRPLARGALGQSQCERSPPRPRGHLPRIGADRFLRGCVAGLCGEDVARAMVVRQAEGGARQGLRY